LSPPQVIKEEGRRKKEEGRRKKEEAIKARVSAIQNLGKTSICRVPCTPHLTA